MLYRLCAPGFIRLLLALLVLLDHTTSIEVGGIAVQLFFLLSGYWVTAMYDRKYSLYENRLTVFYVSRFLRIWPLYALVVLLVLLADVTFFTQGYMSNISLENVLLLGVANSGSDPLGVSWSLDVELQFYLIAPLIFSAIPVGLGSRFAAVTLSSILIAIILAGVYFTYLSQLHTVLLYLSPFFIGVLVSRHNWVAKLSNPASAVMSVVVCILLLSIYQLISADAFFNTLLNRALVESFIALSLLPFILFSLSHQSDSFDTLLGNLAFPLYLIHFPIIVYSKPALYGYGIVGKLSLYLICLFLAYFLSKMFDSRFEAVRKKVVYRIGSLKADSK